MTFGEPGKDGARVHDLQRNAIWTYSRSTVTEVRGNH